MPKSLGSQNGVALVSYFVYCERRVFSSVRGPAESSPKPPAASGGPVEKQFRIRDVDRFAENCVFLLVPTGLHLSEKIAHGVCT